MKITVTKLHGNDLELPHHETEGSAGIDLTACLTLPFISVDGEVRTEMKAVEIENQHRGKVRYFTKDFKYYDVIGSPGSPYKYSKSLEIGSHSTLLIPTGLIFEIPEGYVMNIYPRSSSIRGVVLANNVGVIDSDYRGQVYVALLNRSNQSFYIGHGERIAQAVFTKYEKIQLEQGKVSKTSRGGGGFGSTGT